MKKLELDPERCPIHGLPLEIKLTELTVANESFEILMAKCPKCKVTYIGQKVKKLARFTYNGRQYQYLPKLAELQGNLKDRKVKLKSEEEKGKEDIEKAIEQEAERRNREKKQEEIEKNKRIYAEIKRLNDEIKRKKILEKEQEIKRKQQEEEQVSKKFEEERRKNYPFLSTGKVQIKVMEHKSNKCPIHNEMIGIVHFEFKEGDVNEKFGGFYCAQCNCLYLKRKAKERFDATISKSKVYRVHLAEKRWKNVPPLQVDVKITENLKKEGTTNKAEKHNKRVQDDFELDAIVFKSIAYQKYKKEIAEISAEVDGKERFVRILTSVKEEDKRKCVPEDMLVREAETLGRELLGRIAHEQLDTFYAKGHEITIYQYKIWPGQEHHLDGFIKFSDPEKMQDITIMSQKNLDRDSEEYEMVTALIYCANRDVPVYIDVYYSKRQNKYFINDESYRQYSARYGLPYVRLVPGEYNCDMDYGNLRQYSELNLYGYTVAKTADMSSAARQRLLQQLMDNGLMSKHQIVNHLEWLIHRQSGRVRMEDACDCWKEDLRFVNNYKINQQRRICGRFVYGKTALR